MGSAPPAARRPPAAARPARSRLVISIGDTADVCEAQVLILREAVDANPGDTEIHFHVARKILAVPYRVHVAPPFLKGLKAAAGPSWKWETVTLSPAPRKAPPPPARRSA